ncbi:MAG: hydroxymethylbilane synthase [Caulobacterales bacterium]|nr:hydroxymethylbilane synthase [Caulobacterales bacterium]MCA0372397.1 hydroxymethylbilane synthase [Pseudomonadota bacterium]
MTIEQINIGARGSPLSLAQTGWLRGELAQALGISPDAIDAKLPINPIVTQGDKIQDRALLEAGGKGLFTKELDEALLDGRIDCAIHSMKDVPTSLPDGIVLLGCPPREDRRDALITKDGKSLDDLPYEAKLGTASLRRTAQFLRERPDLKIGLLRGNVGTRIAKITSGEFDATILAMAGLKRLGLLEKTPHHAIDPQNMPPAIAQGSLAITARANDKRIAAAFKLIEDETTTIEILAEREFLRALDGSCRTAIGAYTQFSNGNLYFKGEILNDDGSQYVDIIETLENATIKNAGKFGFDLGIELGKLRE